MDQTRETADKRTSSNGHSSSRRSSRPRRTFPSGLPSPKAEVTLIREDTAHELIVAIKELTEEIRSRGRADAISVTVKQAGDRLACSESRVYELLKVGALQHAPSFGRGTMILAVSVESLAREGIPQRLASGRRSKPEFKIGKITVK